MTQRIISHITAILAFAALLVGCAPKEKNVCHVNPNNWDRSADIVYENSQPGTSYVDISFFVRCNADLDINMLPVVVRIIAPDSAECIEQSIWTFDPEKPTAPATTVQKIAYRSTCAMNQIGKYIFSVTPMQSVRGVEAVGIITEKTDFYKF